MRRQSRRSLEPADCNPPSYLSPVVVSVKFRLFINLSLLQNLPPRMPRMSLYAP
jgi:hypothetical protein